MMKVVVRLLALAVVLVIGSVAGTATARMIMMPDVPRKCREADNWQGVAKCLGGHGKLEVVRQLGTAKLVDVQPKRGLRGLYLYAQRGTKWRIAGMFEVGGPYELLGFRHVTISKHKGYRFDVGLSEATPVTIDGESEVPAKLQVKRAVFCDGRGYQCTSIVLSCDLMVRGKTYWSFRGKVTYDANEIVITGDRSKVGSLCSQDERVELFWDQD